MEVKKWKIVSSEYKLRSPWVNVRRDVCRLPTGVINPEYYIFELPTWVNIIAITREGKFVMVEQYRHGLRDVYTEIVGGAMEEGETCLEAAKRELLEESGYGNGTWREFMTISQNPGNSDNLTHVFLATDVERISDQHLDATEDIKVRLLTEQEVYRILADDEMKQALMAAPLWKYFALKAQGRLPE